MLLQPDDSALDALKLGSRKVPELGHGKSSAGAASDRLSTAGLPLGLYKVYVCADVAHRIKESNEKNNCQLKGYFYVIQKSWYGSVKGIGPANGASQAEKWKTLGAHLDFAKWLGGGTFRYDFTGTVEWNDHGTNNGGCTTNGHGEKDFSHVPGVELNYLRHEYGGLVPTGGHYYTITSSGPPGFSFCNGTEPGPLATDILRTYSDAHPGPSFPLRFDQNKLTGGFGQVGAEDTHWGWDFQ